MHSWRCWTLAALAVALAYAPFARADEVLPRGALVSITLQTGDVVRGLVTREDGEQITVILQDGTRRSLAKREVRTIGLWGAAPPAPAAEPRAAGAQEPTHWYGWQLMLADVVPLSFGAVAAATSSQGDSWIAFAGLGVAGFLLTGPIVHAVHGRGGTAASSVALRLLVPAAAFGLGFAAWPASPGEDRVLDKLIGGAILGSSAAVVAMGIDWFALAREPVAPAAPAIALLPFGRGLRLAVSF